MINDKAAKMTVHLACARDLLTETLGRVNAVLAMDGLSDKNRQRLQRAVWAIDQAYGEVDESHANV